MLNPSQRRIAVYVISILLALFLIGLVVAGCSPPDTRQASQDAPGDTTSPEPDSTPVPAPARLRRAAPVAQERTETTSVSSWLDTTRLGDTVLSISGGRAIGYQVTGTKVVTDTAYIVRLVPAGPVGLALGAFALRNVSTWPAGISATNYVVTPANIVSSIREARAKRRKMMVMMTGGDHSISKPGDFLTRIGDTLRLDSRKWRARMDQFNTSAIKAEVAAGVADGTIIGSSVMDEPEVTGGGDGNTWCTVLRPTVKPCGFMNKLIVDSLARYHKNIFPTLPVGVNHGPNGYYQWFPDQRYNSMDFVTSQYSHWVTMGNASRWRDLVLAQAAKDKVSVLFSMNVLNGGTQDADMVKRPRPADAVWDCRTEGRKGQRSPNCQMTPAQVLQWGKVLAGCGLFTWMYTGDTYNRPDMAAALSQLGTALASKPATSCRRK